MRLNAERLRDLARGALARTGDLTLDARSDDERVDQRAPCRGGRERRREVDVDRVVGGHAERSRTDLEETEAALSRRAVGVRDGTKCLPRGERLFMREAERVSQATSLQGCATSGGRRAHDPDHCNYSCNVKATVGSSETYDELRASPEEEGPP